MANPNARRKIGSSLCFRDELGYCYAGDRIDRDGNSNIKEDLLSAWLTKCGYTPRQINAVEFVKLIRFCGHLDTVQRRCSLVAVSRYYAVLPYCP